MNSTLFRTRSWITKITGSITIVALLGVFIPTTAFAVTLTGFPVTFGTTSIASGITGWVTNGLASTDTYISGGTPRPGASTAQHARLRRSGTMTKTVSTVGYNTIVLKYYWNGDNDGDGNSDNLKVYWKKTSDASYILLNTHQLNSSPAIDDELWANAQVSVSLPVSADDTSIDIRFEGAANALDEEARVDDVSVEGSAIVVPTTATLTLQKTVIKNNGGTAGDTDWTLKATGTTTIQGTEGAEAITNATVTAGTYILSEAGGPSGYSAGNWECTGNATAVNENTLTIAVGEIVTCTITNDDIAPSLTLIKTVSGGEASPEDWSLTATETSAEDPIVVSGTTGVQSGEDFAAGTYSLSESGDVVDYNFDGWDCTGEGVQDGANITLEIGESAVCTVTNVYDPVVPGSITVVKNTIGGDGTFNFTGLGEVVGEGATPQFELITEGGTANDAFTDLVPGAYSIAEAPAEGWSATNATCTSNMKEDTFAPTAIALSEDEAVTCTFTNTKTTGTLTVKKIVINNNEETSSVSDFSFQIDGGDAIAFNESGENDITVSTGSHTITEVLNDAYTVSYDNCSVDMSPGGTATCTITNDDKPTTGTIVLVKNTIGGDGEFSFDTDIQEKVSTLTTGEGSGSLTFKDITPGTYSITEIPVDGWTLQSSTCSDESSPSSISLSRGETVVCTFTNTSTAPEKTEGERRIIAGGTEGNGPQGQVLGATTGPEGEVLGENACTPYLGSYIIPGKTNNSDDVTKLQKFLNKVLGISLPLDGTFAGETIAAVKKFQLMHKIEILRPWVGVTLPSEDHATGWVYKTTLRYINLTECPTLSIPPVAGTDLSL